jgi:hypothetical protein
MRYVWMGERGWDGGMGGGVIRLGDKVYCVSNAYKEYHVKMESNIRITNRQDKTIHINIISSKTM